MHQVWLNGQLADQISVLDRGLGYGDGLFETIRIQDGRPELLDAHLTRLKKGLSALYFPAITLDAVKTDLSKLTLEGDAVLKLMITRGQGQRGYVLPEPAEPSRVMIISPRTEDRLKMTQGIKARFCDYRLAINPALAGIKHLNRLEQVLARAEWHDPDISEGIVSDTDDCITEGTMSNLFWADDAGRVFTPELARCGVAGVMRDFLIHCLAELGIECQQGYYTRESLLNASEIFVCNSLIHIWPVCELNSQTFSPGPVTRQLQSRLKQVLL